MPHLPAIATGSSAPGEGWSGGGPPYCHGVRLRRTMVRNSVTGTPTAVVGAAFGYFVHSPMYGYWLRDDQMVDS